MTGSVRVVKIAPGENASEWERCREGNYICVGWDAVGDLRKYNSFEEFWPFFKRKCGSIHKNWLPTLSRKAKELWTLRQLFPGDKVIANRGLSEVLAVGTVTKPGYKWQPDPDGFSHTVKVRWDTSYARKISPQPWNNTVAPVDPKLYRLISGSRGPTRADVIDPSEFDKEVTYVPRSVRERQGQPAFRRELRRTYSDLCAISNCDATEALEAAHIFPYKGPKSNHPSNGILLRADLHSLFDQRLVGIHPDTLRVVLKPSMKGTVYWREFQGKRIRLPDRPEFQPGPKLLRHQYRLYLAS